MSEVCIVVEGAPKGDWNKVSDHVVAENRYWDGVVKCATCKEVLNFHVERGAIAGECCGITYRVSRKP